MPSMKAMTFQFHKGTIRTGSRDATALCIVHFNSIKVQLEHYVAMYTNPAFD